MTFKSLSGIISLFLISTTTHSAAVFYTDETSFSLALGTTTNIESFETAFTTATSVDFADLTITELGGGSGIVSCPFDPQCGGSAATDGLSAFGIVDTNFNGNAIEITFNAPVNAFAIDVVAALDFGGSSQFILSNDNGDTQTMFTGPRPTETLFVGMIDLENTFTTVTINSTLVGDGMQFDRLQYAVVPVPPAIYLLLSGMIALFGIRKLN